MWFPSVWSVIPLLLLGANMSAGALFHDKLYKTTSFGVSLWCCRSECLPNGGVKWLLRKPQTFSIRLHTSASQWPSKWPAKWVLIVAPVAAGRYGASSRPMAAFSGFWWSPGFAALGNALRIASAHRHGYQNGPQWRYICSPPPPS